jgi:hypothetical protein
MEDELDMVIALNNLDASRRDANSTAEAAEKGKINPCPRCGRPMYESSICYSCQIIC